MKDLPMTPDARKDAFETWLASMDTYLDALKAAVPFPLDYSLDSLKPLEAWLLERYPDLDAAKADMAGMVNNAGCYIGEVIRKKAGGTWRLEEDENNVFFGLPVLTDVGTGHTVCPATLASAATSRRKGDYLYDVAAHLTAQPAPGL